MTGQEVYLTTSPLLGFLFEVPRMCTKDRFCFPHCDWVDMFNMRDKSSTWSRRHPVILYRVDASHYPVLGKMMPSSQRYIDTW